MHALYIQKQGYAMESASDAEKWREIKRPTLSPLSLSQAEARVPLSGRGDHRDGHICLLISENKTHISVFPQLLS